MSPAVESKTAQAYLLQPEEGPTVERLRMRLLTTAALIGDAISVMECINPGPGGPPLHVHRMHDEFCFVLQGRYRFKIGDRDEEGGPGTFVYMPGGIRHAFASVGPGEGRLLAAVLGGGFERFLERFAELDVRGASANEIAALFQDFQMDVVGPPLVETQISPFR